jgi:site-specific recombinase XerD
MTQQMQPANWRSEFHRLEGAYAPSTMRSYRSDVEAFEAWCAKSGHVPFPAKVATLCAFLEDQGMQKAPSTVRRRLYTIRKVHRLLRLPDPTHDEEINLSLRRVRRSKAIRPRQARGLTRDFLDQFRDTQPDTVIGLRNRAMLSVGYELLTRRSELVALRSDDLEDRGDGTFRVLIRRSKADQYGAGRTYPSCLTRIDNAPRSSHGLPYVKG